MTFEQFDLSKDILKALDLLGLETPTKIQEAVIPLALAQKDVIAMAQTGSGKTAAFAIPLCQLVDWEENKPQGLILSPTRELAMQIQQEVAAIGKFKRLKVPALFGKHSFVQQQKDLKQKSHIVVGTPGRVLDHLERGTLPVEKIKYLVIDEADEMLKMGFMEQAAAIIEALPAKRVTLLFSATMPKDIYQLAGQYMNRPEEVRIIEDGMTTERIRHYYYDCTDWDKIDLLQGILTVKNPDSCIIFANTRDLVEQICEEFLDYGFTIDRLHGGMEQWERTEVMKGFRKGEFRYLVATDVAARGIDIASIPLIVNFELPYEQENYLHRIGRTGRAGEKGIAISLVEERELKYLAQLSQFIGLPITLLKEPDLADVEAAKEAFLTKMRQMPQVKQDKKAVLETEIMKIHIADGKKSKIRPVDIVGTICAIEGVEAADIGIITILDWSSYVEILNNKGPIVLETLQTKPIKGQLRKVTEAIPK